MSPSSGSTYTAFVHVLLPEQQRYRCTVLDCGFGTVVSHIELGGTAFGYDVQLDGGRGVAHVIPSQMRRLPTLVPCGITIGDDATFQPPT